MVWKEKEKESSKTVCNSDEKKLAAVFDGTPGNGTSVLLCLHADGRSGDRIQAV